MRNLIKTVFLILMLSSAKSFAASAGWSGKADVTGIYVLNENIALIKLSTFTNPGECAVDSNGDVILNPTTQKVWFTALLSAYMSGKTVNIYVGSGCKQTHWPSPSYGTIGHVRLL